MKLNSFELSTLYRVIEIVTGTYQKGSFQKSILATQIEFYLNEKGVKLLDYLKMIQSQPDEFEKFLHFATIHTTTWFREQEHFDFLRTEAKKSIHQGLTKLKVWSASCSTGQELYSIGLELERIRKVNPGFEYLLFGSDIDSLSIKKCQSGIYPAAEVSSIPAEFRELLYIGENEASGYFTIDPEIRQRSHFFTLNLDKCEFPSDVRDVDWLFCRNTLIYFHPLKVKKIVEAFTRVLAEDGKLILSCSENLPSRVSALEPLGKSVFKKKSGRLLKPRTSSSKRVLVVEDEPFFRENFLKRSLVQAGFEVVDVGSSEEAEIKLDEYEFDLISLDIELPGRDGVSFLRDIRLKGYDLPVVIVSSTSEAMAERVFGAFIKGAQEFICKEDLAKGSTLYVETVRVLSQAVIQDKTSILDLTAPDQFALEHEFRPELILLGASTGGPSVLREILKDIPAGVPPIVVVQHTHPFFSIHLASTLSSASGLQVLGQKENEVLKSGSIYLAFGDYHLELVRMNQHFVLNRNPGPKVQEHRPSVDVLFKSAAKLRAPMASIILTGMGEDGALGMQSLASKGNCFNIAQSEETCVVASMPASAIRRGAVHKIATPSQIREMICSWSRSGDKA